ncbi:MAG: TIM barrel protein, partial [Planctomycetota bacterium]
IRIFAGKTRSGTDKQEAIRRCISACEEACNYAAKKGVFLALENHGGITAQPQDMLQIVRGVRSPWFGVNFDSGNFRFGKNSYQELAKIAPYAINAQIKIELITPDGKKIRGDIQRMVNVLRKANYAGWVVLEYEGKEPAEVAVPDWIEKLRIAIA